MLLKFFVSWRSIRFLSPCRDRVFRLHDFSALQAGACGTTVTRWKDSPGRQTQRARSGKWNDVKGIGRRTDQDTTSQEQPPPETVFSQVPQASQLSHGATRTS